MEANKEDAELSRENGEAALRNEDFEKAVRLFRKAARMSPDDSSITALSLKRAQVTKVRASTVGDVTLPSVCTTLDIIVIGGGATVRITQVAML